MLGIPVETFENLDALNPLNWFDSSDFEDKFTSWFEEVRATTTAWFEELEKGENPDAAKLNNITKNWPKPDDIIAEIKKVVLNGIPDVMNRILTGGFNTKGFNLTTFTTGIKDGFDDEQFAVKGGGNWFRGIVDWFVDIFKQLFAWIFHPISAAFSSVYGFCIALCYIYITIQCVGILVELFSIAKIIAG